MPDRAAVESEVRRSVRGLLERTPAYRKLSDDDRHRLAENMVQVAARLAGDSPDQVDFPVFVDDLVHGTFQAIVDASIKQMDAYAELLASVSVSQDDLAQVSARLAKGGLSSARPNLVRHKIKWPP